MAMDSAMWFPTEQWKENVLGYNSDQCIIFVENVITVECDVETWYVFTIIIFPLCIFFNIHHTENIFK